MLGGGGGVEMWLGNWNVIVSISWNGDVEMLLYLSPEMESVVFVQIFFSIYIYIYIFIYLLHSVINIYWHKVLCRNVNNMNRTCYYIFILV